MFFRSKEIIFFGEFNGPLYVKTSVPFTQRCFVPSLVKIGPVVLYKKNLK